MNGGSANWFVFVDGADPVGPVTLDLLARGLVAGKVPKDAQVARGEAKDWRAVLEFPDLVAAMDEARTRDPNALAPLVPDAPNTDTDMTEVLERDDELAAAFDDITKKKKPSGAPPKPPPPPSAALRASGPLSAGPRGMSSSDLPRPPAPLRASAGPPSASRVPAASAPLPPRVPSIPPELPPVRATAPSVPPPPVASIPSAPPPPFAPAAPATSPMPITASAPPPGIAAEPKKDEPKKPTLDPRMIFLPLGIFGVFAFLSLLVVVYALITKSYQ